MKSRTTLLIFALLISLTFLLAACGSDPATISDIPAYPNATALQEGEDPIADTLAQNMEQDAQLRESMGMGGDLEQMAYRLPAGTTWEQVQSFYNDELADAGWESGMGGPGGSLASDIMNSVNSSNELFQTASWNQDKQIVTIIRNMDPTNEENVYLFISLSTN